MTHEPGVRKSEALAMTAVLVLSLAASSTAQEAAPVAPGTVVAWVGEGTEECRLDQRRWPPRGQTCYYPVDLRRTGQFQVHRTRNGRQESRRLTISDYPYPVQRIELQDDSRVHLSPEDVERSRRESRRVGALWSRRGPSRFTLPLLEPLDPLPPGGRFGAKRIYNGQPRSPHSGADYSVPQGTPVRAPADGVVALAEEHFFGGNSVFLDHGDSLITMYLHLSEILVTPGAEVKTGDVIGKVGSTGRATGPHLHFGVRWHGARVDPALLLEPAGIQEIGN